mmetsp:Transcript_18423/g.32497  ORF Transcript_18423/g.32497 Transcript_18423/m.32497 type:complete len:392 (-) Transcript_18423:441-1616(-)
MCLGTHRKVSPVLGHRAIDASLMNVAGSIKQEYLPSTQSHQCNEEHHCGEQQQDKKMPATELHHLPTTQDAIHNIVNEAKRHKGAHIIVQHNYHDHSHDIRTDYTEEHPARGGVSTPFPLKLHEMLEGVKAEGHDHIVSWQPHGRCFVVHKPKEFVELLPHYFKLSKLASFQRQLNLYGFQRLTRGRDRGGYYHELFLRGKQFLAHNIQRIKVKGTGVRARSNPDAEPDFWSMPWMGEDDRGTHTPTEKYEEASAPTSSSFVYPGSLSSSPLRGPSSMLGSPVLPIVSPPSARSSLSAARKSKVASAAALPTPEEDLVCAFGNKTFHYLDPFQPLSLNEVQRRSMNYACAQEERMNTEAESFFQDFQFPDNIGSEIENDAIFGDMLESLIS